MVTSWDLGEGEAQTEPSARITARRLEAVRSARRVATSDENAEDVAQEVMLLLWADPGLFDARLGTEQAFVRMLARRRAIDQLRSSTRRTVRESRDAVTKEQCRTPTDVEDEVVHTQLIEQVRQAVVALPATLRDPIALAFWGDLTYREVAVVLDLPEGTAKSRLRVAMSRLRRELEPFHQIIDLR